MTAIYRLLAEWGSSIELEGCAPAEVLQLDVGTAKMDLTLGFGEQADGEIVCGLTYSTDIFVEATAQRMAQGLQALLLAGLAAPDAPVAQLPMMEDAQRGMILQVGGWQGWDGNNLQDRWCRLQPLNEL